MLFTPYHLPLSPLEKMVMVLVVQHFIFIGHEPIYSPFLLRHLLFIGRYPIYSPFTPLDIHFISLKPIYLPISPLGILFINLAMTIFIHSFHHYIRSLFVMF